MSLFLFSSFPKFVDEELNRRRKSVQNGEPAYLQEPKTPWMRMISGFKPEGGNRKVLMGGDLDVGKKLQFGFEDLYETQARDGRGGTTGEKYRPKPTITSISVDEKLQSFECTVEWKAHSIGQLERLFPHFMSLGTSVIVDFGWSDVPSGAVLSASSETEFRSMFEPLGSEDSTDVESANSNISPQGKSQYDHEKFGKLRSGQGKYSFVSGAIVNFSYSPDENGTFSCTTEVMSVSKAMRKLRTKSQKFSRGEVQDSNKENQTLYSFIQQSFEQHLNTKKGLTQTTDIVKIGQGKQQKDLDYMESGKQSSGYYVSWGELERLVNKHGSLKKDGKESNPGTFEMDSSDTIISGYKGPDFTGSTLDGRSFTTSLSLATVDPLVCIVDTEGSSNRDFRKFSKKPDAASDEAEANKKRQGFLYNLYINHDFIKLAFGQHETVFGALEYILNQSSAACFDIWDFELEVEANTVKVIDKNMPAENTVNGILSGTDEEFVFRPNTNKTVLRNFSFDTNLDDRIKAQVVAQRSFESSDGSKPAQNAKNDSTPKLFSNQYPGKDVALGPLEKRNEKTENSQSNDNNQNETSPLHVLQVEALSDVLGEQITQKELQKIRKNVGVYFSSVGSIQGNGLVYKGVEEGESLASKFERVLQSDESKKSPINSNNYLGMGAQLELDGIGGFTAYQVLKIEQIPKIFQQNGVFSVESVSHSVSPDDWTTELDTTFVIQNQLNND